MNKFKGTKGKWGYSPQKGNKTRGFQAQVWREDKFSLALIEPTENQEEATANAQLIAHAPEMYDEIKESITDLLCIQSNVFDACKTDNRWEGVYEIIQKQIDRKKDLLTRATTI